MGRLSAGRWTHDETETAPAFVRPASVYGRALPAGTIEAMRRSPARFHLIASMSCPWSHRVLIVRALKRLQAVIPVHVAHGPRVEGYPLDGGAAWPIPGTARRLVHLHELYSLADPAYSGRATVPLLWDSRRRRIISNESAQLMRAFDAIRPGDGTIDFTLRPSSQALAIDALNAKIYAGLSNAVYEAGFALRQAAYEAAVQQVFATLDDLEERLSAQRFLLGATITEADWRLFPTLARFDAVYFILHRCSRRRLIDYPHLWAYARDLYAWRGVARTVDFDALRIGSYTGDTLHNPHGIVAAAPLADWRAPHGRDQFGAARVALRSGATLEVEPRAFDGRTA